MRRPAAAAFLLMLSAAAVADTPRSREDCATAHPAAWGRAGKDVPWVPTFDAVMIAMLSMAQVTPEDRVLDLGAGDGRIAITAAKPPFGARARGIEYDAELAQLATCLVAAEGVSDRVTIVQGDIFKEDFGDASVITMYLLPQINVCVRHRVLAMPAGTRVVSHQYAMGDWKPDRSAQIQGRDVHLWVVPARVDGAWDFQDSQGGTFTAELRQSYDALAGEAVRDGARESLATATLQGAALRFAFGAARFSGTVHGDEIRGVVSTGTAARTAVGRLQGSLRPAPWAEIPADCRRYYAPAPTSASPR